MSDALDACPMFIADPGAANIAKGCPAVAMSAPSGGDRTRYGGHWTTILITVVGHVFSAPRSRRRGSRPYGDAFRRGTVRKPRVLLAVAGQYSRRLIRSPRWRRGG